MDTSRDEVDYNPGGSAAKRQGCTCPRIENRFGEGIICDGADEPSFFIHPECPLHKRLDDAGRETS